MTEMKTFGAPTQRPVEEEKPIRAQADQFELAAGTKLSSHWLHRTDAPADRLVEPDYWAAVLDQGFRVGDRITVMPTTDPGHHLWTELVVAGVHDRRFITEVTVLATFKPRLHP
jgi:hypothetical protein